MKILDRKGLSGIIQRFIELIFIGGILIILGLPFVLKWYIGLLRGNTTELYAFLLPFLYVTGILAAIIVFELRKIFITLNRMDPFRMDNVKSFRTIAICCFIIAAAYVVKIFMFNSFLTIILFMVFVIGGFMLLILSEVFRQAVIVKQENDLTI
ncbi:MAG: DUF2975 domain-containing protein [Clostridiaceae bacterium]|nr:DUF2975 domain-containing protein [Clostridiaceae bacterium]